MDKNGVDFGVYCRVVLYSWFFEFPLLSGVIIPTNHHLTTISSNVELLNFDTTKNWSFYHFKWCLTARIKSKNVEMTMFLPIRVACTTPSNRGNVCNNLLCGVIIDKSTLYGNVCIIIDPMANLPKSTLASSPLCQSLT